MKNLLTGTFFLVVLVAVASGCVSDRIVAPGEMRDGVLTDWYAHKTLYAFDVAKSGT